MRHLDSKPTIHAALDPLIALAAAALTAVSPAAAQSLAGDVAVTGQRHAGEPVRPVTVAHVRNLIGMEGVKPNETGRLDFGRHEIRFAADRGTTTIPLTAVRGFAVEHTSKPLLRGIPGAMATLAPNGGGQVYSMIRPGAEFLTVFYTDDVDALHGAVILIPKSSKAAVLDAFARRGFAQDAAPVAGDAASSIYAAPAAALPAWHAIGAKPSVEIEVPKVDVAMPLAFTAGAYEQVVAQTERSGLFGAVWRQGDRRASPAAMTLSLRITDFRKGSAGVRGAIPVAGMIAGMTRITADLVLADASGAVILDQQVKGSKRMMGESMAATRSLAQRVTASLAKGMPAAPSAAASNTHTAHLVANR